MHPYLPSSPDWAMTTILAPQSLGAKPSSNAPRFRLLGTGPSMESECGFDRSQLYSDEGPPMGKVAAEQWAAVAPRDRSVGGKMELSPRVHAD
jgi:hypothetical protein